MCRGEKGETDTFIVSPELPRLIGMAIGAWKQHHRITIASSPIASGKLAGLPPEQPYELLLKSEADAVIVEADGARHHMIKAPAEHEPVIPTSTNLALPLISAEALNQPLTPEIAHRPELVANVTGLNPGDILAPAHIARLVISEQGALKHIPETVPAYLLLTHATSERLAAVQELAALVRRSLRIAGVLASAQPREWCGL